MNKCNICGRTQGLNELSVPCDTGKITIRHVCNVCWETIAELAILATTQKMIELEERLAALEDYEPSPYEAAMLLERAKEAKMS